MTPVEGQLVAKRGVLPTVKIVSLVVTMAVLYVLRQFIDVDRDLEDIINVGVPLVVAYFVPNPNTPGGVPDARLSVETAPLDHSDAT